jgi:hypothetical protein
MATRINIFAYLIFAIIVIGCESEYSIDDTDSFVPELVVNSFFAPDSTWKIYVSRTKSVFDSNTDVSVSDAEVTVTDISGNFNFDFTYSPDGYYTSSNRPIANHVYRLLVKHADFDYLHAVCQVPTVEYVSVASQTQTIGDESFINLEITSLSEESKQYYYAWELVEVVEVKGDSLIGGGLESEYVEVESSAIEFRDFNTDGLSFIDGSNLGNGSILDSLVNVFYKGNSGTSGGNEPQVDGTKIAIKLIAISNDMYNFYTSIDQLNDQPQSSNNTSTTKVYSNVSDGLGIFAGYIENYILVQ